MQNQSNDGEPDSYLSSATKSLDTLVAYLSALSVTTAGPMSMTIDLISKNNSNSKIAKANPVVTFEKKCN